MYSMALRTSKKIIAAKGMKVAELKPIITTAKRTIEMGKVTRR
jgi:hypothetical protein